MEDEAPNVMNLNLNLGLNDISNNDSESEVGSFSHEAVTPENWTAEAVRLRQRREQLQPFWRRLQISPEDRNSALGLNNGEGSIAIEETKTFDKNDVGLGDELFVNENHEEKGNDDTGSFFDCNVCLDLANDPIVTCCGHLFCWTCIYKWLHLHSVAKECPVCKGEVTLKNVIPIYGRGESIIRQPVDDMNLKIPNRPQAPRFETGRQFMQRSNLNAQIEDAVRRRLINRRVISSRIHPQRDDAPNQSPERSNQPLYQIHNPEISHENVFDDLTQRSPANSEAGESSQIPSVYLRRMDSNRSGVSSNMSTLSSAERYLGLLLRNDTLERDSMSSVAAIIESDSQTAYTTTLEIDSSTVLLSTPSSRRRNNPSRASDVVNGDSDSHAPMRRRRLN